jgi:riboflavin transporter FmnP
LKKPKRESQSIASSIELAYLLLFTALAIILHIFQFPFPLATFLTYDLSGIPIAILMLISLRLGTSSLPIFWLGAVYLAKDPTRIIGPSMKVVAEAFTAIPLAIVFKKLSKTHSFTKASIAAFIMALISRVGAMLLLNYLVTPYWLLWAGWMKTFETAYDFTMKCLPYIAIFNATVVCYVVPITLGAWKTIRRLIASNE